jgi:hypothetical protein
VRNGHVPHFLRGQLWYGEVRNRHHGKQHSETRYDGQKYVLNCNGLTFQSLTVFRSHAPYPGWYPRCLRSCGFGPHFWVSKREIATLFGVCATGRWHCGWLERNGSWVCEHFKLDTRKLPRTHDTSKRDAKGDLG